MTELHATTNTDRQVFVTLQAAGWTYAAIAEQTGGSLATVRKHCTASHQLGPSAWQPQALGRPRRGCLSTFDPVVRLAALRLKVTHPTWGPAVIRDELQQRASTRARRLPHPSQLAAYFQQFGSRLVQPQRHLRLPPAVTAVPDSDAGLVYQLDMQERLWLPQLGYFNVLNMRAPRWGITVGSYPHPAGMQRWNHKVNIAEAREDCRATFEQWGLPEVLQTDPDTLLVGVGNYPFPSLFVLWLIGLGVVHRLIARVIQNGSVERSHRTFDKQMLCGVETADWPTFLKHVAAEQVRLNERIPSRARACQGLPPLVAHPEARVPRRPYRRDQEDGLFEMQRVYAYLAGGRWLRHVTDVGQVKLAEHLWTVGKRFAGQTVVITFAPTSHEFVISTEAGQELKRIAATWLTETAIRGLPEPESC